MQKLGNSICFVLLGFFNLLFLFTHNCSSNWKKNLALFCIPFFLFDFVNKFGIYLNDWKIDFQLRFLFQNKNVLMYFHIRVNEVCNIDWLKHFDKWNKYMIETAKKNIIRYFFLQSVKYHLKIEEIYEYKHSNINSTKIYIFFFFSKRKPNNLFFYTKTRLNFVPPLADYFITYNLTIIRQSWTQMQYKKCKNMGTIDGFLLISLDFLQIQI